MIYPILSEAVRGEALTVGPPYYNFFLKAFGLPLLLLMGIGPLVAWRRASLRSLGRSFAWPAGVALHHRPRAAAARRRLDSIPGLVAYSFSAFVLASIVLEFARGTRARRALSGEGWAGRSARWSPRNRRRYGGYIVHASIVLLAIGVAGSSAYDTIREAELRPGESMAAGPYTLAYERLDDARGRERRRAARGRRRRARRSLARHARGRQERLPRRGPGLERGRASAATGGPGRTCS